MDKSMLKTNLWVSIGLIVLNVVLFNVLLRNVSGMRLDMTEGKIYSLSDVTKRILGELDEEVTIKFYASEPENIVADIRPFVPELQNLINEYAEVSDGMVRAEFIVPEEDPDAEEEANSKYGLQPYAAPFRSAREQGIRSFYFGIVVDYAGTNHETIAVDDLIAVTGLFEQDQKPEIELKNAEFAMTRAIKKAVLGFEGQRELFDKFQGKAVITTYVSPEDELPEIFKKMPADVDKVLAELAESSRGKLEYVKAEIPKEEAAQRLLLQDKGVAPLQFPTQDKPFYLWWQPEIDGRLYQAIPLISLDGALGEFELKERFEGFFKQITPGVLRKVGVAQKMPDFNPMMAQMGRRPPPAPYSALVSSLDESYETTTLDYGTLTQVPADVDLLLVMGPREIPEKAAYAIDQYVMRGGRVIMCLDEHDIDLKTLGELEAKAGKTGLEDVLATWGVTLSDEAILDRECGFFTWTVGSSIPGRRASYRDFHWAAMPLIGAEDSVNRDVGFLGGVEMARFLAPSAIELKDVDGIDGTWLLRSSEGAWKRDVSQGMNPDISLFELGHAVPDDSERGRHVFATLLEGTFPSYYADRPVPSGEDDEKGKDDAEPKEGEEEKAEDQERPVASAPLKKSPADTKVVIFANSEWLNNVEANISSQLGYPLGLFRANSGLIKDAVDWMLEDEDLIQIRNRGRTFRPLRSLEEGSQTQYRYWNFIIPLMVLGALGLGLFASRKNRRALV